MARERERDDRGDDRGRGRDRDDDRGRGRDREESRGRDRDDDRRGRDDDRRGRDDDGGDERDRERAAYGSDDAMRRRANQQGGNFVQPYKAGTKTLRLASGTTNLRILPPTWDNPEHYALDVWMHSFVGSSGATFLCPKKMLNKPCPACDEVVELKKAGEDKDAKQIEVKQKCLCWVIDRAERKPEPQLWAMSWTQDRDIAEQAEDKKNNTFLKIAGDLKDTNGYDIAVMKKGKGMGTRYTFQVARDSSFIEDNERMEEDILKFIEDHPIPDQLVFADEKTIRDALDGNYSKDDDDDDDDRGGRGRGGRGRDRGDDDDRGRGRGRDRDDDSRGRGRDSDRDRDRDRDDDRGRGREEGTRLRGRGEDENVREDTVSQRANRDRGRGRDEEDPDDRSSRRGRDEEDGDRGGRGRDRDDGERGGRDRGRDRGRGRDRDDDGGDDDRGRDRDDDRGRGRGSDRDEDRARSRR